MSDRFVHVGLRVPSGQVPVKALEGLFSSALNWLRYDNHCWILYTNTDLDVWRDRIRALPEIKEEDTILLLEVNPKVRSGYASDMVWNWLRENADKA